MKIVRETMLPRRDKPGQNIYQEPYRGRCLRRLGLPDGGLITYDSNIRPVIGDLVVCCKIAGANSAFIKQVLEISNGDYLVGTAYEDPDQDYTFIAGQIRGTVTQVTGNDGKVVYKRQ